MSKEITEAGKSKLPAYLQGYETGVTTALMQAISLGGNRIGLKGSRFRLVVNGVEEGVFDENYLDVIVIGAAPAISRVFYEGSYKAGENVAPTCYSADGIVPAQDVKKPQSDKCATCPQNVKGSKIVDGNMYKACQYFRRLVVMLAGDTEERNVYKLDVKALGLFGESSSDGKSVNLNDYIKKFANRGIDIGVTVTRLSFDTDSSVPKLLFRAVRYVSEEEMQAVQDLVGTDEVNNLAAVNMTTVDLSDEHPTKGDAEDEDGDEDIDEDEEQEVQKSKPTAQKAKPTAQKAKPTAQKAKPTVQKPNKAKVEDDIPMPGKASKPSKPAKPAKQEVEEDIDDDDLDDILAGLE